MLRMMSTIKRKREFDDEDSGGLDGEPKKQVKTDDNDNGVDLLVEIDLDESPAAESDDVKSPCLLNPAVVKATTDAACPCPSGEEVQDDDLDLVETDDDEDESLESNDNEINPFLFNPVMKVLMSQMTIEDLKKARGVCGLWDYFSTLELQKLNSQMKTQKLRTIPELVKFENALENSSNRIFLSSKLKTSFLTLSASSQGGQFFQNLQPKYVTIDISSTGLNTEPALALLELLQSSSEHLKKFRLKGRVYYRQRIFDDQSKWAEDLKFPQLEGITLKDLASSDYEGTKDIHYIIKNVIKNSPKFKTLNLTDQPGDHNHRLCDEFVSCGLMGKLKELSITYARTYSDTVPQVFAHDLFNMAKDGLRLTKFAIVINFNGHMSQEVVMGQLGKLKEFLATQSETLVHLKMTINIGKNFLLDAHLGKFDMPPLPNLKVLELTNVNQDNYLSYNRMNLSTIFPNLVEMNMYFNVNFCDLSYIFNGSLEGVKKVRIKHPEISTIKNYIIYRQLENLFPNVVEFEVDHMHYQTKYNCIQWSQQYKQIPWEQTLKKLTLRSSTLEKLRLNSISHLRGLVRLELVKDSGLDKHTDFNFELLSSTNVKSLKIQNYLLHEELLKEIRNQLTFDYIPSKSLRFHKKNY